MSYDALCRSLDAAIDAEREPLIALCAELVAARSVSPPGDTRAVAAVVSAYLAAGGVRTESLAIDPIAPNVLARIDGSVGARHVIFNAHMDTMEPGRESDWTVPIYELTRRDGRLYGLGLGNMKGALAAMCLVSVLLSRRRAEWPGRITMTAVCDEVLFGERGSAALLAARPDLIGTALISGEGPGFMGLALAEKGVLWLDVETQSPGGHSSRAVRGGTAISELAAALERLDTLNDSQVEFPAELASLSRGEGGVAGRTSVNIGRIEGGTLRGQMARSARAELDVRLPPGITIETFVARARALVAPFANTRIEIVRGWNGNWTGLDTPLARAVTAAILSVRGAAPTAVVRLPASDAMRWRARGVPAVCYGPQPTLSAGCDDHVLEQDLLDCAKVYARTALALLHDEPG